MTRFGLGGSAAGAGAAAAAPRLLPRPRVRVLRSDSMRVRTAAAASTATMMNGASKENMLLSTREIAGTTTAATDTAIGSQGACTHHPYTQQVSELHASTNVLQLLRGEVDGLIRVQEPERELLARGDLPLIAETLQHQLVVSVGDAAPAARIRSSHRQIGLTLTWMMMLCSVVRDQVAQIAQHGHEGKLLLIDQLFPHEVLVAHHRQLRLPRDRHGELHALSCHRWIPFAGNHVNEYPNRQIIGWMKSKEFREVEDMWAWLETGDDLAYPLRPDLANSSAVAGYFRPKIDITS